MFGKWAALMFRRRRLVIALWAIMLPFTVLATLNVGSVEGPGTFTIPGSQSDHVATVLVKQLHQNGNTDSLVIVHCGKGTITGSACSEAIHTLIGRIQSDRPLHVTAIDNPLITHHGSLISRDRRSLGILVSSSLSQGDVQNQVPHLRNLIVARGLTTYLTGNPATNYDYQVGSNQDLDKGNAIAIPLLLIVLIFVFATLVGAGMPMLLALFSIPMALSGVWIFAHFIDTSIYATNVVEVLGLGISIDYSLFIVYRFREELRLAGGNAEAAIIRTMETTGRAVFFSGITVGIGMAALLLSGVVFMQSLGLAGILVPVCALFAAMTLLPAVLAAVGRRINRFRVMPLRMLEPGENGPWHRYAHAVMNRPLFFGGAVLVVLVLAALPTTHLAYSYGGLKNAPKNMQSIQGYLFMQNNFNNRPDPDILTIQAPPGSAILSPPVIQAIGRLQAELTKLPTVTKVYGPATFIGPSGTASPATIKLIHDQYLANGNRTGVIDVISSSVVGTTAAANVVRHARTVVGAFAHGPLAGFRIDVGGSEAAYFDWDNVVLGRFPFVVAVILLLTYCFLFFAFRSVFLPLKAVLLNLLSVLTAYGIMVLVFQGGIGSGLLGFSPEDGVATWVPIFMFAFLFGLSMDYEVLLLSRIREQYLSTGSNRESVAFGLEKTGRLITSAALIMVIAFSSFVTGHQIQFKEFGLGLVVSIAVDATLVRVILVPSIMEIMGDWNWWVPARLRSWSRGGYAEHGSIEPKPVGDLATASS